jgi:hypothetical protein
MKRVFGTKHIALTPAAPWAAKAQEPDDQPAKRHRPVAADAIRILRSLIQSSVGVMVARL